MLIINYNFLEKNFLDMFSVLCYNQLNKLNLKKKSNTLKYYVAQYSKIIFNVLHILNNITIIQHTSRYLVYNLNHTMNLMFNCTMHHLFKEIC